MRFIKFFENFSTRYFDDINDLNNLSKRYRKLALDNHPDKATDEAERVKRTRIMQEINNQKEEAERRIEKGGTEKKSPTSDSNTNNRQQEEQKAREEEEEQRRHRERKAERPRQKKPKLTPEEIQKIKKQAVADYKETMSKAKSSKERKDMRAKVDFDNKVKQNPSVYDSARFAYKRILSQNEEEYQSVLRQANALYTKLTKEL